MKPVSNICRLFSHNFLQKISNKACFGTVVSQKRCIGGLNLLGNRCVNLRGKTGASLCAQSGQWFSVMEKVIPNTFYIPRRMAGHSHYANIKDTKEKKDKLKAMTRNSFIPKIVKAIRDGGSTKPSINAALDKVLKEGKRQCIPNSTMERVIKREEARLQGGSKAQDFTGELLISGGLGIVVVGESKQKLHEQCNICVKKFPGVKRGNCLHMFEKKGNVLVMLAKDEEKVDMDKYLEIGIDIGAEEVELEKDSEDEKILKFICPAREINRIDKELSSRGLEVLTAEAVYEPNTVVEVNQEEMEYIEKIISRLNESDEVSNVFMNAVLE
ncbi:hypothetical protein KUTeg_008116 [Tegillarca granosa]|uniref:Transcriptional regulatory protein n=1 Tax=Tegillarca granosa TaxID=220873 RepID=A0ABQ9FBB6_TEGGR|nr:hypothetical protein KUTeg_008116 [Tegillarca granosa]